MIRVLRRRRAAGAGSAAATTRAGTTSAATPVTVTVGSAGIGQSAAGFAGFSCEKDRVGAGMFEAHDTNLVNLFRLLGPSVLRLGGNLVDMVNKGSAALTATVHLAASAARAAGYPLTAPSLTSKSIAIAGSGVSVAAAFHPAPQQLAVSGSTVTVTVPAGSAMLIVTG